MVCFQKDVHAKNSTAFRGIELLLHGDEFSFPPCDSGDKIHGCENLTSAHWTGSWATGSIMLEMQKKIYFPTASSQNQKSAR